jgi:hypothetical protein
MKPRSLRGEREGVPTPPGTLQHLKISLTALGNAQNWTPKPNLHPLLSSVETTSNAIDGIIGMNMILPTRKFDKSRRHRITQKS